MSSKKRKSSGGCIRPHRYRPSSKKKALLEQMAPPKSNSASKQPSQYKWDPSSSGSSQVTEQVHSQLGPSLSGNPQLRNPQLIQPQPSIPRFFMPPQFGNSQLNNPQLSHPPFGNSQLNNPQLTHPQLKDLQLNHPQFSISQQSNTQQMVSPQNNFGHSQIGNTQSNVHFESQIKQEYIPMKQEHTQQKSEDEERVRNEMSQHRKKMILHKPMSKEQNSLSQLPNAFHQQSDLMNQQPNLINQQPNLMNHQPNLMNQQRDAINQLSGKELVKKEKFGMEQQKHPSQMREARQKQFVEDLGELRMIKSESSANNANQLEEKGMLSEKQKLACFAEWFYSSIDRPYFLQEEFHLCLKHLGYPDDLLLSKTEWTGVRASMGRPRRLSKRYVNQERKKLNQYRSVVRKAQVSKVKSLYRYIYDDRVH